MSSRGQNEVQQARPYFWIEVSADAEPAAGVPQKTSQSQLEGISSWHWRLLPEMGGGTFQLCPGGLRKLGDGA